MHALQLLNILFRRSIMPGRYKIVDGLQLRAVFMDVNDFEVGMCGKVIKLLV